MPTPTPTRDEVHAILATAADVIFSDGVSEAFLDHWVAETLALMSIKREPVTIGLVRSR